MKYLILFCLYFLQCHMTLWSYEKGEDPKPLPDFSPLGALVIQDNGRMKPLDTFARITLMSIAQRSTLRKEPAINWLGQLMMDPQTAYSDKQFKVLNPAVIDSLGVERAADHHYSYRDLAKGFEHKRKEMEELFHKDRDVLSLVEKQRMDLYATLSMYLSISRSLSAFWPDMEVADQELATALGVTIGDSVSMAQLLRQGELLERKVRDMLDKGESVTEADSSLQQMIATMNRRMDDKHARSLHVVPSSVEEMWQSPWDLSEDLKRPELAAAFQQVVTAAYQNDVAAMEQAVTAYNGVAGHGIDTTMERLYNKWDLFYRSIYFYAFGLVFLILAIAPGWKVCNHGSPITKYDTGYMSCQPEIRVQHCNQHTHSITFSSITKTN